MSIWLPSLFARDHKPYTKAVDKGGIHLFRMTVEGATAMPGRGLVVTGSAHGTCRPGDRLILEGSDPPRSFTVKGVAIPRPGVCSILIDLEDPKEGRRLVGQSLIAATGRGDQPPSLTNRP